MNCERATIFMVNEEEQLLELVVANVEEKITFPLNSGIAGQAACGNIIVNIPNAYEVGTSHSDGRVDRLTFVLVIG